MNSRLIEDIRALKDARLHLEADASLVDTLGSGHACCLPTSIAQRGRQRLSQLAATSNLLPDGCASNDADGWDTTYVR